MNQPSYELGAIVEAEVTPEKVMSDWKAYASRSLNQLGRDVREAIRYVVEEQGEPMAVFLGEVP